MEPNISDAYICNLVRRHLRILRLHFLYYIFAKCVYFSHQPPWHSLSVSLFHTHIRIHKLHTISICNVASTFANEVKANSCAYILGFLSEMVVFEYTISYLFGSVTDMVRRNIICARRNKR